MIIAVVFLAVLTIGFLLATALGERLRERRRNDSTPASYPVASPGSLTRNGAMSVTDQESLDLAVQDAYERGRQAMAIELAVQQERERAAFERAAMPEGGGIIPAMDAPDTHWRSPDATTEAVRDVQETIWRAQGNVAHGYAIEAVRGAGKDDDNEYFYVTDARTGQRVGGACETREEAETLRNMITSERQEDS